MFSPSITFPRTQRRALFALVVLVGSFLLFLVQPLVARLALPLLGGAPNVWNSAMLTFQALLLGGYAYAHMLSRVPVAKQAIIHLSLLAAAGLTLPIALPDTRALAAGWEVLWVPLIIGLTVGPVFLLVSAQASLMQNWFASRPGSGDPYALYAASNLGSFAGLITYPFLLEPRMDLAAQSHVWTIGYIAMIGLVVVAAASSWQAASAPQGAPVQPVSDEREEPLETRTVLLWLALAAVPSGLMLSTTTLLTTDLMAMPLLWVIPLGLYLLSFSLAFSDKGDWSAIIARFAPILLLSSASLAMVSGGHANPAVALVMVSLLFVLAVALHGRLYALRPGPSRLTFFYLIVATGGVLGGIFTALLAPMLFDWVYEHAILLLAAGLLLPHRPYIAAVRDYLFGTRNGRIIAGLLMVVATLLAVPLMSATAAGEGTQILLLVGVLICIGIVFVGARWPYVLVLALLMVGHHGFRTLELSAEGARSRTYFGVYSVVDLDDGAIRQLNHGTTIHGKQWLDPARRLEPTSYYGRSSGIGIALDSLDAGDDVGVVGLGTGTLACYRQAGQDWTFYEIDGRMLDYSRDGTFTFLSNCAPEARVVIGDARLELANEQTDFDLLAIDAFSSDSIPLHLMTREAFATYGRTLDEDGLLLIHISNRFIDFAPMISALAQAEGWQGRLRHDRDDLEENQSASIWIALARDQERLERLEASSDKEWSELPRPARRAWTDDNASILPLIRW
ncbi:hypothetical protein [Erythrobacter sp.]|uniref:hypothetical protein n=1 Tax=Erythrobacter sp. TaxID=1042 RepID=UPI003C71A629